MSLMETENPILYLLMRTDMASMNPGKAIAQGAHAANQFTMTMRAVWNKHHNSSNTEVGNEMYSTTGMPTNLLYTEDSLRLWECWEGSAVSQTGYAQGFGTTITLDVGTEKVLTEVVECARAAGCPAEVTFDPTYPLVDGDVVHLLPVVTCGYVFGDKNYLSPLLSKFNLHP